MMTHFYIASSSILLWICICIPTSSSSAFLSSAFLPSASAAAPVPGFRISTTGAQHNHYHRHHHHPPSIYPSSLRPKRSSLIHTSSSSDIEDQQGPTFTELYDGLIPSWLLSRAEALGFERPTMVQREALGAVLEGKDVVIQAQTGE